MKTTRIIPRLDIKGPTLVKGIHLEGLRVLGKPTGFVKYCYESDAEELMLMDEVGLWKLRHNLNKTGLDD